MSTHKHEYIFSVPKHNERTRIKTCAIEIYADSCQKKRENHPRNLAKAVL